MRLPLLLEPLRHRDFRLLWTGQTISVFGTFLHQIALPFQLLALGASPVQLGTGVAIASLFQLVFILFGGAIVDRVPRRLVIIVSDTTSGFVVSAIGILGLAGQLRIEHLYLEAAYFGIATSFFLPAMNAIVPELVPAEVLVQGNALRGMSRQFARITGPVVGGILVATAGPPAAYLIDGLTFLVSAGALFLARPPRREVRERKHLLREIREGLSFTFSITWLWVTILLFALVNAGIVGALVVALPILVRQQLHADAAVFGLINAGAGAGEILGGILVARGRIARIGLVMYLYAALGGLAIALMGIVTNIPGLVVLSAAFGVGFVGFGVLWESAVQRHVPAAMLGRVTSVDYFGAVLLGPIAPVVFGVIVEQVGPQPAFVIGGTLSGGLCLLALLVPSIRGLRS